MPSELATFLAEVRRRRVWRVAAAYGAFALATALAVAELYDDIGLPEGTPRIVIILLAVGFPLALSLAWIYEVRREEPAASEREDQTEHSEEQDADHTSIVVLPFANLSSDSENEYFADGMTEEIINALANISGLRVIARTSSFAFKGSNTDIRHIGKQLGVGTVLEGSVRKAGDRLRITAQLIDVSGGHHLWSERYDRQLEDVFAIQDEIAQIIARRLQPGGKGPRIRARPTDNLEAYEALLRGRFYHAQATSEAYTKAVEYFERATELDPDLAEGHAGLARTWSYWALFSDALDRFPRAKAAAERALELEPASADAHATLGVISCFLDWDWQASFNSFERAIELNPGSLMAHHDYASCLGNLGKVEEARVHARQCVVLDPLSSYANHVLAFVLWVAGDLEEALEYERRALEIAPGFVYAQGVQGLILMEMGQVEEAESGLLALLSRSPDEPLVRAVLADLYAHMDRRDDALDQLDALRASSPDPDGATRQSLAHANSATGDMDEALRWIRRGMENRDSFVVTLKAYRWWDPLRSDPRFEEVLREIGLV